MFILLPVAIVLVPDMLAPSPGLLHHQLGVVMVELATPQQILKGGDNLLTPTDHVANIVPSKVPQTNLQQKYFPPPDSSSILHLGLFVESIVSAISMFLYFFAVLIEV